MRSRSGCPRLRKRQQRGGRWLEGEGKNLWAPAPDRPPRGTGRAARGGAGPRPRARRPVGAEGWGPRGCDRRRGAGERGPAADPVLRVGQLGPWRGRRGAGRTVSACPSRRPASFRSPRWVLPPPSQPRGAGAASGRSSQTLRPRGPGHPVHVAPSHGKGTDASFAMKTAPLGLAGRELLARIPGPLLLQALQHPGGGRGGTGPSNKSPALAGARRPSPMRAPARGHPAGWGSAPTFWKAEPRPPGRINASWALSERRTPTAWEAHPEWPAPRGNFYWKVARCSSLYLGAGPPAASGSQPHGKKFNGPSRHQPPPCPLAHPK